VQDYTSRIRIVSVSVRRRVFSILIHPIPNVAGKKSLLVVEVNLNDKNAVIFMDDLLYPIIPVFYAYIRV